MNLPPFLLDEWLDRKSSADPPIEYDLGSSAGPVWTLEQLLDLAHVDPFDSLADTRLVYPPAAGSPELRTEIAAFSGVHPDDVVVVTGASEALWILFFLAAERGGNVVVPHPGFPPYAALAASFGLGVRSYKLRPETAFAIDVSEIETLIDAKTQLVLINSPHNPTGAVMSDADMARVHDLCADKGVLLVSDEVFHPIHHGAQTHSAARLPYVTVLGDLSKALCLSGLRIGWIVDRDAARLERCLNARRYFTISNTALSERLATIALRHRQEIYARAQRASSVNLAVLDRFFDDHRDQIAWVRPRGGMTAFPCFVDGSDARAFCERLMKQGVLLVPGDCFGIPSHFRLGFGSTEIGFSNALDRVKQTLAQLSSAASAVHTSSVSD
jgi:aspartate/methionine/tyrosine aminotransferase